MWKATSIFGKDETREFQQFYARWSPAVFTFLQLYTGEQGRAEEVSEQAFLAYFRQGHELETPQLPLPLVRYARALADETAPRRRDDALPGEELEDVLGALAPEQRAVFILRSVIELERSQVAFAVGITSDRAEQLWSEALLNVRELWLAPR